MTKPLDRSLRHLHPTSGRPQTPRGESLCAAADGGENGGGEASWGGSDGEGGLA